MSLIELKKKRAWLPLAIGSLAITAMAYAATAGDRLHFLDGYVWAYDPTAPSYTATGGYSYDRMGGAIQITRSGTGKYKAEFGNLTPLLGKSIVHVTGYTSDNTYCHATQATVASNNLGVHCFDSGTGDAADAYYSVAVTRNYTDNAFAFANQLTGNGYVPAAATSWNSQGAIHVYRSSAGVYDVVFSGLGSLTGSAAGEGGHFQAQAVGTSSSYCNVEDWGGSPDLGVSVLCFSATGAAVDTEFSVLFELPSPYVAYAWANSPTSSSYTPSAEYSWNPTGASISITRSGTGEYSVTWSGFTLLDGGNVQVTAYGSTNAQCKVVNWGSEGANIRCFAPGGGPVDALYTVFLGS